MIKTNFAISAVTRYRPPAHEYWETPLRRAVANTPLHLTRTPGAQLSRPSPTGAGEAGYLGSACRRRRRGHIGFDGEAQLYHQRNERCGQIFFNVTVRGWAGQSIRHVASEGYKLTAARKTRAADVKI
jgi:hypothetical protein